jgi:hypothetical protein
MAATRQNWDDGIRCAALTLWAKGSTAKEIEDMYGMSRHTLTGIKQKSLSRGWVKGSPVLLEYVQRSPQSGILVDINREAGLPRFGVMPGGPCQ